jgi:hypothetical protein
MALRAARLFLLMMGDGWICGAWRYAVQVHDKSVPIPEISLFRHAIQVIVSSSSSSSSSSSLFITRSEQLAHSSAARVPISHLQYPTDPIIIISLLLSKMSLPYDRAF